MLSKIREPFNGLSHLGGAIAALFGLVGMLIVSRGASTKLIAVLVYGFGLLAMFTASAVYHMAKGSSEKIRTRQKIDHSAIFLLIAGTYTPFCLLAFTGIWRWGLLTAIWIFAALGILIKSFNINSPRWLHVLIYVLMGWLCVMAAPQMPMVLPAGAIFWLFTGGIIYTLGAVIYGTKIFNFAPGKFGFHEVWHIFVLLGALAHFMAVMVVLIQPVV